MPCATCDSAHIGANGGLMHRRPWLQLTALRPLVGLFVAGHRFNRRLRAHWWAHPFRPWLQPAARSWLRSAAGQPPPKPPIQFKLRSQNQASNRAAQHISPPPFEPIITAASPAVPGTPPSAPTAGRPPTPSRPSGGSYPPGPPGGPLSDPLPSCLGSVIAPYPSACRLGSAI